MTRWWHQLIDRPLHAHRLRAFTAVACVLMLVAAGLARTAGNGAPSSRDERTAETAAQTHPAVVSPTFTDDLDAAPTDDGRDAVIRQGRRFLAGYLPYLYGQGAARAIRASTTALRRRLTAARLRVSPAARKRRPRVVRVSADQLDRGRWHVVATIADGGVSRYPIELLITTSSRGVRVAGVVSE